MDRSIAKKPLPGREAQASRSARGARDLSTATVLHDRFGNGHLQTLARKHGVQAKRTVSQPGDPWEREADQVADLVTSGAPPSIQRACGCAGGASCDACSEDETVQRKASSEASHSHSPDSGAVDSVLSSPGEFLRGDVRQFFESRIDRDLSDVRVHTGEAAADSARDLDARAYTVGSHIIFGAGEFAPDSRSGQHLLAHELTHVVQQTEGDGDRVDRQPQSQPQPLTLTLPPGFGETTPPDYVAGPLPAGTVIDREDEHLRVIQSDADHVRIDYGESSVAIRSEPGQHYAFMLEAPRVGATAGPPAMGGLVFVGPREAPPTQRVLRITATTGVSIDPHILDIEGMPQLVLHTRYTTDPERVYTEEISLLHAPLIDVREYPVGTGGAWQLELDRSAIRITPPGADESASTRDYPGAKFAYWIDPLFSGPNKTERQVVIVASPGVQVTTGELELVPRERGYDRSLVADIVRVPHPALVPEQGGRIDPAQFINAQMFGGGMDSGMPMFGDQQLRPSEVVNVVTGHEGVAITHPYTGSVVAIRPQTPSLGAAFAWQVVPPTNERFGEIRLVVGPGVLVDFTEPLPRRLQVEGGAPAPTRREQQASIGEGLADERVDLRIVQVPLVEDVPPLGLPINIDFYLTKGWLRDPDSHHWMNTSDTRYMIATGLVDAGIGFIPVVGFLYDLANFSTMLATDHDIWGWEVTTFDKIVMGICVVIGAFTTLGVGSLIRGAFRASARITELARALGRTPEEVEVLLRTLQKAVRPEEEEVLRRSLRAIGEGAELAEDDIRAMQSIVSRVGAGHVPLSPRFAVGLSVQVGEEAASAERALGRGGWRSVLNPETITFLIEHPQIARSYDALAPEVRRVLTLCESICVLPRVVNADQEKRILDLLDVLKPNAAEEQLLKTHFHLAGNLDEAIEVLEKFGSRRALQRGLRREVDVIDAVLRARDAWRGNQAMRVKVRSILTRGMKLEEFAPIMDAAAAAGEGGERLLHYVDKLIDLRNKGVKGVNQVMGSLGAGYGFFQGEEWILRYIDRRGLWNSVEQFEITAELTGSRRWDAQIAGVSYQFKSWRQMYDDVFVRQIFEDYVNTNGLRDPLRWVFEPGRGIGSEADLIHAAEQAVRDAVPGKIPASVADDIIAELRSGRIIELPVTADVSRSGTVIP